MNQSSLSPTLPAPPPSTSITIASPPPIVTITSPSTLPSLATPALPQSVQSLPVVIATPQPQPQPPISPGLAENLAFVEALKMHIDTLSPEEQLQFKAGSTTITPEALISQTRKYNETHNHTSRSRQCASRVEGFLKAVDAYLKPLSIMIGHNPQVSSLVIRAVRLTMQVCVSTKKTPLSLSPSPAHTYPSLHC